MAQQRIEKLLEKVRTVEGSSPDEGLILRRVIEKAEDNWNRRPDTDNTETIVVKLLSADDLNTAAESIGLAGNEAVIAFIESAFDAGDDEAVTITKADVGSINAVED